MVGQGDRISFRLTDVGRYILGLAGDFSYRPEKSAGGEIVVQPNFEIVFLSPSPLAEAMLARFAERLPSAARGRRGIGALFKITRAAIYAATYNRSPEFYEFWKAVEAYRVLLPNFNKTLTTEPEFFDYLYNQRGR